MNIQDCTICLEATSEKISCCNLSCSVQICSDCFTHFLSHCLDSTVLPICVGQHCEALYLKDKIPSDDLDLYQKVCWKALIRSDQGKVDDRNRQESIAERLKAERRTFLHKEIPIAVSTVAEIVFKSRLEQVHIPEVSNDPEFKRRCMNVACPGMLDHDLICDVCLTQFCEQCESVFSEPHQCKEEDVATVNTKKSFPKCPNCHHPMDKDNACNHVRCGLCGTKFIYGTDQRDGSGGHTEMVEVKDQVRLSAAFRELLSKDILKELLLLESLTIEVPSYKPVVTSLQKLSTSDRYKPQTVKALNEYYRKLYRRRHYYHVLREVETEIKAGTLTTSKLTNYYQLFV